MSMPKIVIASEEERERISSTLILSFSTDPMLRWLWPEANDYAKCIPGFDAFCGGAIGHGSAYRALNFEGVAMWFPPGFGGALMKEALVLIDEQGLPSYLESSNPRNISLYERHGFEVMGTIQFGTSPVITPMIRTASV
jgi:hypothetical protein